MSKLHDKESLLNEVKLNTETVTIGGRGVILTEVSAAEYMDIYNSPEAKNEKGEWDGTRFTSLLVTRCIVDGKGQRMYDDADADKFRNGSTAVYTKLAAAVRRLNGLGAEGKN